MLTCKKLHVQQNGRVYAMASCMCVFVTSTARWRRCSIPLCVVKILSWELVRGDQMNLAASSMPRLLQCAWASALVCLCAALTVSPRVLAFCQPHTIATSRSCKSCASATEPILALLNRYLLLTPLSTCAAVNLPSTHL